MGPKKKWVKQKKDLAKSHLSQIVEADELAERGSNYSREPKEETDELAKRKSTYSYASTEEVDELAKRESTYSHASKEEAA